MTTEPTLTTWSKSSRSGGGDNCVEVAFAADRSVSVRHSKHRDGAVLTFTPSEWAAFVAGVVDGELHGPQGA